MADAALPAVETRPQGTSITISETDVRLRTASLNAFKEEVKVGPRKVYMRFRIFDVKQVDAVAGTAFIDFGLYLRWFDPSLINISKKHFGRTVREYESLWSPKVGINNAVEMKELWDGDTSWNLKSYETGEMKYSQRYSGTIANQMDLRLFLFDADLVEIKFGPRVYKAGKVVFEHDPEFPIDPMEIKSPCSLTGICTLPPPCGGAGRRGALQRRALAPRGAPLRVLHLEDHRGQLWSRDLLMGGLSHAGGDDRGAAQPDCDALPRGGRLSLHPER